MSNMHKRIIGAKKTDNYINTGMLRNELMIILKQKFQNLLRSIMVKQNMWIRE